MVVFVHSPTLLGEVVSPRERGVIAFGSAQDWLNAHGGCLAITEAVEQAIRVGRGRFIAPRGIVWKLTLHGEQPRQIVRRRAA